jgi:hypothetical protein
MVKETLLRFCWRIGMACVRKSFASYAGRKSICVMGGCT